MSLSFSALALLSSAEQTLLSESPWQQSLGGPIFPDMSIPQRIWLLALRSSIFDIPRQRINFCSTQRCTWALHPQDKGSNQGFLLPIKWKRKEKDQRERLECTMSSWYGVDVIFKKVLQVCFVYLCEITWDLNLTPHYDSRIMALSRV